MKMKLFKFVFVVLFLLPFCAYATDITFTTSGTISGSDVYEKVYVQDDGTVVDMFGGQITNELYTDQSIIFNMSGGEINNSIRIGYFGTFNVSGGTANAIIVAGPDAVINVSGGSVTAIYFETYPDCVTNINGGDVNIELLDILAGEVNIYRGLLNVEDSHIGYDFEQATINIYGSGFNYSPSTQILTGYLLDNNLFTIKGVSAEEYTRFNLIPEPATLMLLALGGIFLRNKNRG